MKTIAKILLLMTILIIVDIHSAAAQDFKTKTTSGFDLSSGSDAGKVISISDKDYSIYYTTSGSEYIKCLSARTGNEYAVWLGSSTELDFNYNNINYPVRITTTGKFFILAPSKSGQPYPKYLDKQS
tara:strand:- start:91 stop:471 length:381 start_codon:yes stop_codon:yes gene_type:complete